MEGYKQQFSELREQLSDLRQDAQNMNHDAKGMLENLWEAFCQVNISAKASAEVRLRTAVRASASEYELVVRSLKSEHKGALQMVKRACGAVQLTHRSAKQEVREALKIFQVDFAVLCSKLNSAFLKSRSDAGEATRARDELAGRYMQLRDSFQQLEDQSATSTDALTLQLQQADADKAALQIENATLSAKLAAATRDLSSLQERAKQQSSQYAADLSDARVELAALTQDAAGLRAEASSMAERYAACSSELDAVTVALSCAQQEAAELGKEVAQAQGRAAAAKRDVQAWKAQCKALEELMLNVGVDMPRMMDDARAGVQRSLLCMRGRPGSDAPPTPGRLPPPQPPANPGDEEEESRARKRSRQGEKEALEAILADSRAQLDALVATSRVQAKEQLEEKGAGGTASVHPTSSAPATPPLRAHAAVLAWRRAVETAVPVLRAALA